MLGALILLAEAAVLTAFCADLARDFSLLSPGWRSILIAAACVALVPLFWRGVRRRVLRPVRAAAIVLTAGSVSLGGMIAIEEAASSRMLRHWAEGGPDRLRSRADLLEADFAWLLQEMVQPFERGRWDAEHPREAFRILERAHESSRLPAAR